MNTPKPDPAPRYVPVSTLFARFLIAAFAVMTGVIAHAQVSGTSSVIATDNAGNYSAFGSASSTPGNGGSGFGAWNFTSNSTTNTSFCGEFLGAAPNTGLIGSGNSWGIYSNTSNTGSVYRGFGFDIIGDTISVDLENTSTINGTIGWSLWNASQTNMTEFYFASGSSNWTNPNAAGASSSVSYTTSAIQTDLTITSATTFSLAATINGGASSTTTGSFTNGANATGISDLFRFFSFNDGSNNNIYFNNEKVFTPTYSGTSGNFGTAGNWSSNGQLTATPINGANLDFGGAIAGTATNNLLTTVNSYTFNGGAGSYTLSGSSVTLGSGGSDNAGITNYSSNLQTVAENLTIGTGAVGTAIGATVTSASGAITLSGNLNLNGSRVLVAGTGNTTFSGVVSGASDILKQGTGTLFLTNAGNTFSPGVSGTANVYIDAGTVSVGATGALGATDGSTTGYVNVGSSVLAQSANATSLLISAGGVTVSNPVDVRYFSGQGTYGTQTIGGSNSSGTVTFSGPIALHNALAISSVAGGTVNISGAIATGGTTGSFAGESVNGTPGVTITGGGVVKLAANNTYSGPTAINGGSVILSGSLTGTTSATVASGASLEVDGLLNASATTTVNAGTLQGTGSTGPITANGGAIAPGLTVANSTSLSGTLTVAGNVTLSSTSTFAVRLGYGSGTAADQLAITSGSASLGGASLQLTLGGLINSPANINHTYVIIDSNSPDSGTFSQGNTISIGGFSFAILNNQNDTASGGGADDVDLMLTAIPEPHTWSTLALGAFILLIATRRRQSLLAGRHE